MKLETELKPGDIVLLKVLACILILFFTLRFLVFPGLEKNQDLKNEKEQVEQTKQEMQDTIKQKSIVEKKIVKQKAELVNASQGFYDLLENQQVDELVTGIALKHNLKPVYLKIEGTEASTQNRFDFQHISDHSDTSLDSSGTGKIFQIADGENTVHFANVGFQKICRFVYVHAPIAHFAGIDGEDALCKRGIQGIDEADFTFSAVFLKKLLGSKSCGVISSADVFA